MLGGRDLGQTLKRIPGGRYPRDRHYDGGEPGGGGGGKGRTKEVGEREEKGERERERERRVRGKRDGREEENVAGSYSFKLSLVTHYCVHNSLPD